MLFTSISTSIIDIATIIPLPSQHRWALTSNHLDLLDSVLVIRHYEHIGETMMEQQNLA